MKGLYPLFLILLAEPAFGQALSFGVAGGVPLSDAFSTPTGSNITYTSVTRRYTIGPEAVIGLPLLGLRVAADALYQRIGWDSARAATPLYEPFQSTVRLGAWDFDALLERRFGHAGIHPYLGAGPAFRRFFTTRENYFFPDRPADALSNQLVIEVGQKNIAGIAFAAGLETGGAVRIAPEFRYTRWLMDNIPDSYRGLATQANQAEFLLSIRFGRR